MSGKVFDLILHKIKINKRSNRIEQCCCPNQIQQIRDCLQGILNLYVHTAV